MTTVEIASALRREIGKVFPNREMPSREQLPFHKAGCAECSEVADELDELRSGVFAGAGIRSIHQQLSHLSAATWLWVLPHYLLYCLSSEGIYNRFETEFLIYNLGPDLRFQSDAEKRLSLLNASQRQCLVHFLEWCLLDEYWRRNYADAINKALGFIRASSAKGTN